MNVFQAGNCLEFLEAALGDRHPRVSRGAVKSIANYIGCHATHVSQVFLGKAFLSHEQAVAICAYAQTDEDETEFFIDLLNRDRAGDKLTKVHFDRIIRRKMRDRGSLQKRAKLSSPLTKEREILYFHSWRHPVVHAALQIKGNDSVEALSENLGFPAKSIIESLELLSRLKLAVCKEQRWQVTQNTLHVGKNSELNNSFHSNWRLKTASLLMEGRRSNEHTHFSAVFAISYEEVELVRHMIIDALQTIRGKMVESPSERLVALCLDYFPVAAKED